jgi:hypothetical protein
VALCDRCGEEIALTNDIGRASNINRRRHLVMVACKPRSLTATHWRMLMLCSAGTAEMLFTTIASAPNSQRAGIAATLKQP